ncbi:MAG: hypothetical protein ACLQVG_33305 [Terriglobia bacterium]
MRIRIIRRLVAGLAILIPSVGLAQSDRPVSDGLIARLSYASTYMVNWRQTEASPHVCIALYRSGHYQVVLEREKGTEFLQGELSKDQLLHVTRMLEDLDFESSEASLIRRGSESFEAEIHHSGETARYVWIDPDHQRPFPKSAIDVVHWLRNFKAAGAFPLPHGELNEQQICPSEKGPLPLTAGLRHAMDPGMCGGQRP